MWLARRHSVLHPAPDVLNSVEVWRFGGEIFDEGNSVALTPVQDDPCPVPWYAIVDKAFPAPTAVLELDALGEPPRNSP